MPETIVKLTQSYDEPHNPGIKFDAVTLREPRYNDVFRDGLGAPVEYQPNGSGGVMVITHFNVIDQYIDRLAIKPTSEALAYISAVDSMRLAKAVTDFFSEPVASNKTPTGSSSEPVSPQT